MSRDYRLTAECHLIPLPDKNVTSCIAYFPLQSLVLKLNQSGIEMIKRLKKSPVLNYRRSEKEFLENLENIGVLNGRIERAPKHSYPPLPVPYRTMLLISEKCNLRCLYCYGDSDGTGEMLSLELGKAAVNLLIDNAKKTKSGFIDIGFHGGGEPTLNWAVLTSVVEYAERMSIENGMTLRTAICTNGIITQNQAVWLAGHIKSITISIDGPPEIQNLQRPLADGGPSYDQVLQTADILSSLKKPFVIRSTATEYTQGRLTEVYSFLSDRFHPAAICIEPVFSCGRCETSKCRPPEAAQFIKDINKILNLAKEKKIPFQYSGGRVFLLDSIFCGAAGKNFFITPGGDVTSCLEVTKKNDPRSDLFIYGKYDFEKGIFNFDIDKYRKLCNLQVTGFESCNDCFARWHCSGDCLAKAPDIMKLKTDRNSYRCAINRDVTRQQLFAEITKGG